MLIAPTYVKLPESNRCKCYLVAPASTVNDKSNKIAEIKTAQNLFKSSPQGEAMTAWFIFSSAAIEWMLMWGQEEATRR